ncbi:ClpX ATPase regulatory subunit [Punctularia strigosozonata HHB-11173 SS5]|uniref:ClpX ATPase regulatory subunit n=1 Tax=Punctularia strigosozonata (strain HHB-11173) TaxID=741275 RepID=UPI0004417B3F|nr:ClpX ATPase regulatory subunit [Punctularia strigosozonata HHB-11173 SS5]EIN10801.1 ClpX ATPase regulatory subunit [Punctularia strigosozonata HHB-11173 SS5]
MAVRPTKVIARLSRCRCTRGFRSEPNYAHVQRLLGGTPAALSTPRQLVEYLDEYVVGQEYAKKVLSVAMFNHYNRVRSNLSASRAEWALTDDFVDATTAEQNASGISSACLHPHPYRRRSRQHYLSDSGLPLFEKSNVLVIGPTGSGKTLLAKTLARIMDVPFSINDATSFTQAGYVGDDVDVCITRLLQAADWDPQRASTGIVYIDEVDKISRKAGSSGGLEGSRDVGGEGVQQALLRMMEGSIVSVQNKGPTSGVKSMGNSPNTESNGRSLNGPRPSIGLSNTKPDTYHIDTSNVLFILSGAFVGLEKIIKKRTDKGSIGFTATLSESEDRTNEFMPFFTRNQKVKNTSLAQVEPSDLIQFGFIPEFVSRLPCIATLTPLTPSDLRRILTDVRGSLVSQYTALFACSDVEIRFSSSALDEISRKAAERGGGARGLRGIMENLLLEPMYEVPGSDVRYVLITDQVVKGEGRPRYWTRGQGASFWNAWADDEGRSRT